jgi:hypothetical protein
MSDSTRGVYNELGGVIAALIQRAETAEKQRDKLTEDAATIRQALGAKMDDWLPSVARSVGAQVTRLEVECATKDAAIKLQEEKIKERESLIKAVREALHYGEWETVVRIATEVYAALQKRERLTAEKNDPAFLRSDLVQAKNRRIIELDCRIEELAGLCEAAEKDRDEWKAAAQNGLIALRNVGKERKHISGCECVTCKPENPSHHLIPKSAQPVRDGTHDTEGNSLMCACVGCSNCAELPNGYCTPCKERITKGAKPDTVTPSTNEELAARLRRLWTT